LPAKEQQGGNMPVIAIANQKGGVAKTATAFNLAHALVKHEKKVLMVDLDPQGSLTDYAGYEPASLDLTIYPVLHKKISAREAVIPHPEGPDLLPANIDLAAIELELAGALEREFKLADALEDIRLLYDYIVLDCPPTLGLLTINGLIAADQVLIPAATNYSSLRGLKRLYETIGQIQKRPNPNLKILGVLPTLYDSRTLHAREALEIISEQSDSFPVFTPVAQTVRMQESPVAKLPIFDYQRDGKAAFAYLELAEEIING
jgi:chromosome partitioning protein